MSTVSRAAQATGIMADENANIVVADANGFATNDFLVITDKANQWAHLFQVTGVNAGTGVISHSNTSAYNTGHTNWPPSGFPNGAYVYVLAAGDTAEQRPITVARTDAERAVVTSGVKVGELIIVDGQSRVIPGAKEARLDAQPAALAKP